MKHWTEHSVEKFRYRITSDFVDQLIKRMETEKVSRTQLAKKLGLSVGRVSQILNGEANNFSIEKIIQYARALNMKVSLIAYDDHDPDNTRGPIDSEIFATCWQRQGSPVDYFELNSIEDALQQNVGLMQAQTAADNVTDMTEWKALRLGTGTSTSSCIQNQEENREAA